MLLARRTIPSSWKRASCSGVRRLVSCAHWMQVQGNTSTAIHSANDHRQGAFMTGSSTTTVRAMTAADAGPVAALSGELGYPSTPEQIAARFRLIEERPEPIAFL